MLYPALVAACFIAGTPARFAIAALDGAAQWLFFIPELQWVAILTYAFDAALCVIVLDFLNRSFDVLLDLIEHEKQSGRQHYLVSRELHHRIQNMFQIVQAVVRLSLPESKLIDSTSVRDRLLNRIEALSATNLMITESEQNSVLLSQIVENEVKPFGGRVHLTYERGLMIGGQMARTFRDGSLNCACCTLLCSSLKAICSFCEKSPAPS